MYYIFVKNNEIDGKGQCKCLNDDILNFEVSQDIYDNSEKYIFKDGKLILNPDFEKKEKQKERERLNKLFMTKREMFLGLYQAKGITPDMLKTQITDPKALIEFEYANDYFRGNPLIDTIGTQLGFTPEQLDKFFETKDYTYLLPSEQVEDETEQVNEQETEQVEDETTEENSAVEEK